MNESDKRAKAVIEVLAAQNNLNEVDTVQVICAAYERGRQDMLLEAIKAAEDAKCGSETPWDCGCDPGIKAIKALAQQAQRTE